MKQWNARHILTMTFRSVTQEWDKVRPHKELSDLDLRFVKWNTTLTSVSFDVMVKHGMWVHCHVFLTHSWLAVNLLEQRRYKMFATSSCPARTCDVLFFSLIRKQKMLGKTEKHDICTKCMEGFWDVTPCHWANITQLSSNRSAYIFTV